MAERRMFAKTIIDSDAFLEMPQSTQLLYFHLAMRGDDDGFINKPKSLMLMIGAKDDDLKILAAKKFIIPFESGIVVIKHWKIHNYIAKDRYNETKYKDEKSTLSIDDNGSYTKCIQPVDTLMTQVRLGKVRLGKVSINREATPRAAFIPPAFKEVEAYCIENNYRIDAKHFLDYYSANDWKDSRDKPIKNWKLKLVSWANRDKAASSEPEAPRTCPVCGKIQHSDICKNQDCPTVRAIMDADTDALWGQK